MSVVVMVERWASAADLAEHATGAGITQLGALTDDALAVPTDVKVLQNVPFGDPAKGTIR